MRNSFWMRRAVAGGVALGLLLLGGCGGGETKKAAVEKKEAPKAAGPAPAVYQVKFTTTKGDFVVEIQRDWAPFGADRFHELIQAKFYDKAKFYRVVRGFVAQWGIAADPKVDMAWRQLQIPDDPVKQKNRKGTLTFARSGPNTRTTQVFINLRDNLALDSEGFAPIGRVVSGMDVVEKLTFLYGDIAPRGSGPDGKKAAQLGNSYLEREFPRLDAIQAAEILP